MRGLLHSLRFLLSSKNLRAEADRRTDDLIRKLETLDALRIIARPALDGVSYTRVISLQPVEGSLTGLTSFFNGRNIAIRSGLHCAPSAHKTLRTFQTGGTLRLSPGLFTTEDELNESISTLKEYIWQIRKN